jgi:hypothetical protein
MSVDLDAILNEVAENHLVTEKPKKRQDKPEIRPFLAATALVASHRNKWTDFIRRDQYVDIKTKNFLPSRSYQTDQATNNDKHFNSFLRESVSQSGLSESKSNQILSSYSNENDDTKHLQKLFKILLFKTLKNDILKDSNYDKNIYLNMDKLLSKLISNN